MKSVFVIVTTKIIVSNFKDFFGVIVAALVSTESTGKHGNDPHSLKFIPTHKHM